MNEEYCDNFFPRQALLTSHWEAITLIINNHTQSSMSLIRVEGWKQERKQKCLWTIYLWKSQINCHKKVDL